MRQIVVGVDGSENSRRALEWAGEQARRQSAELVVVHAWNVPAYAYGTSMVPFTPTMYERLHHGVDARKMVESMVADAALAGVQVDVRVTSDGAGRALVEAGRDASMIVVGSRGRSGLSELVLGSTARYVSRHASVPVVVIPQAALRDERAAA
jgi:nucleotide-binding universal stress UspA family protein